MKTVCIIQARMGSNRLPGKVLMEIKGVSVLEHIINRILKTKEIDEIIIATSVNEDDNLIYELAQKLNINCIRGSLNDVLERYYDAMKETNGDIVVRITGDCPCVDYKLVDEVVGEFKKYHKLKEVDYMNNSFENNYPRGYDIEVFTKEALESAFRNANKQYEREHVTPYLYDKLNKFKVKIYKGKEIFPNYRVTLDTQEDFLVIKSIFEELYDNDNCFGVKEVVKYLEKNEEILNINKNIKQKKIGE